MSVGQSGIWLASLTELQRVEVRVLHHESQPNCLTGNPAQVAARSPGDCSVDVVARHLTAIAELKSGDGFAARILDLAADPARC